MEASTAFRRNNKQTCINQHYKLSESLIYHPEEGAHCHTSTDKTHETLLKGLDRKRVINNISRPTLKGLGREDNINK